MESVFFRNVQCIAEDVDDTPVITRIKFHPDAVLLNLGLALTVQTINAASSPNCGILKFGEKGTRMHHALGLKQQVAAALGIVAQDVNGMPVLIQQKFRQELRGEGGKSRKWLKLWVLL